MRTQRVGQAETKTTTETPKGGNGEGLKAHKGKRYTNKDFKELCLIIAYIVQRRGAASHEDVMGVFQREMQSKVHPGTLGKVLEALRKKEILAANYQEGVRLFSMKRVKFNCSIELAHLTNMIPTLEEDAGGVALMALIEGIEGKKKEEGRYPQAWADYEVRFKLLRPWLGGTPYHGNPMLQVAYEKSPYRAKPAPKLDGDPNDMPLLFPRSTIDGALIIHRACVSGFLKGGLRSANLSPFAIEHFHVEDILVRPEPGQLTLELWPVMRADEWRGKGGGLRQYEALVPGVEITWTFAAPSKNFISPANMEHWLRRILRSNGRSMSPARGNQTGKAELLEVKHELWKWEDEGGNGAGNGK
jgi:hypothetical protein